MPTEVVDAKPGNWARLRRTFSESLRNFLSQDSLMVSGSIAYHGLLALFPLMLFTLSVSGVFIRHYELSGMLAIVLERFLPMKSDFILRNLVGISQEYGRVGFVSLLLFLWSSSGVFLPLEKALNHAWEVDKGRRWLRSRLLALEMALTLGFVLLASSALVGMNISIHRWMRHSGFTGATGFLESAYHLMIFSSTFALTLAMFLVLFQRLPNRRIGIRQAFPSALITAVLWEVARSVFAFFLPRFNYRHVYGSIGAVVALMTWAYVSSAVTLFGAQMSNSFYRTLKAGRKQEAVPTPSPVQTTIDVW